MKNLLLIVLLLVGSNISYSQTTLLPGDIAFVGVNVDGSFDDFSFVVLADLDASTQIKFTDQGWIDG
ncbi:MAG: hypothetical protein QNK23_04910, partial [Crocinitomicaceae bacterium]|nr:hypothetical protein [Crocinitomicaceae bacterium]